MKTKLPLLAFTFASLWAAPAFAADPSVQAFLKIDGIKGESTNVKHKEEIDLAAFKLGVLQQIVSGTGGGGGAGKATFGPITVFKGIDKASPLLFLNCAVGKHFPQMILTLTEHGKDYFKVRLQDVVVSACDINSNNVENGDLPLETIALSYSKVEITYTPFGPSGAPGAPVVISFDVKANTSTGL